MTRKPLSTPLELTRKPYPVEAAALRRAKPLRTRIEAALETQWARPAANVVALYLPYPTSTNRLYRRTSTGVYRAPAYATWFRAASNELNAQHPGKVSGPYELRIVLGRPDRRRRDLDNIVKSISDVLVLNRVVDDDSQAIKITLEWSDAVTGAHVFVLSPRRLQAAA